MKKIRQSIDVSLLKKLSTFFLSLIGLLSFFAVQETINLSASSPTQITASGIVQNGLIYEVDFSSGIDSNLNGGTLENNPTYNTELKAYEFNGTNQRFYTKDLGSELIKGTSGESLMSLEFWGLIATNSTNGSLVSELGTTTLNSNWFDNIIEVDGNQKRFAVWPYNTYNLLNHIKIDSPPRDSFNHYTWVYDGNTLYAYVNGVLENSGVFTRSLTPTNVYYSFFGQSNTTTNGVGSSGDLAQFVSGALRQVRIYNRHLSAEEVFSNYVFSASQLFTAEIGAPESIVASSTFNTITVDWSAPVLATDPITGYQVEYKRVNDSEWTIAATVNDSSLRTVTITNLLEQENYYVRVAAKSNHGIGLYGYPWQKLFETTNPRRNSAGAIVYTEGYGLGVNDAYVQFSGVEFSRVRYYMSYNSPDNFVDADFNRVIDRKGFDARVLFDQTVNLQVPAYGASSEFIVKGDVNDLQFHSSGKLNRLERGLTGRLELWPYDYITGQESQFTLGLNGNSIYDDNDIPFTSGGNGHGSFQLHEVSQGSGNTIFAWNHHRNTTNPEMGFGNSPGTHRDWTFSTDYTINANRSLEYFYLGVFINPAIQTDVAGEAYQIQLNLAGGTVGTNPIDYTSIDSFPITLPTPTRTDYTFLGWYATSNYDGSVISEIINASSGSFELYAKWITGTAPTITGVGNRTLFTSIE
jgi:uncharacterized repeat protein (TIGR02543 family)